MEAEISRINKRADGPIGVQYSLRSASEGMYPDVRSGEVYLKADDVWKYGETINPGSRYNQSWLESNNLIFVPDFQDPKRKLRLWKKQKFTHIIL